MPRLLHHVSVRYRSNVGFAFYDFENAATKKVAVLIFGIFCTRVFAKGPFRRPLSLRASAPRVLRWKTLARFLSSAPLRVRIPLRWAQKGKAPIAGSLFNQVVGDEGCPRAAGAARFRFVASLLACCAGKRFAFPQLRTLAGSNPMKWAQTKTVPFRGPFPIQWWAMRDSNPQPCACKAPALTVAPIARRDLV